MTIIPFITIRSRETAFFPVFRVRQNMEVSCKSFGNRTRVFSTVSVCVVFYVLLTIISLPNETQRATELESIIPPHRTRQKESLGSRQNRLWVGDTKTDRKEKDKRKCTLCSHHHPLKEEKRERTRRTRFRLRYDMSGKSSRTRDFKSAFLMDSF